MNDEKKEKIADLNTKLAQWVNFLSATQKEDEQTILENGKEGNLMAWTESGIQYYFDQSTMNPIDTFVAKNAGIYHFPEIVVSNYYLRKGKDACLKQIDHEILEIKTIIRNLSQI